MGVEPGALAGLPGTDPRYLNDDRYRTPAATDVRIWELMTTKAAWPELASLMTAQSGLGTLGVWDYLITSARTPLEGLRDAVAFLPTVADPGTEALVLADDGQHVTLSHVNTADLTYETASAIRAYSLGLLVQRLTEAARRPVRPVHVTLTARAPRHHQSLVGLYGTRAVDFETQVSSITFRSADLHAPQPSTQPGLSALLRRHAEQNLASAIPLGDWLDSFRAALHRAWSAGTPTLPATAQLLSLSARTLQRRLGEHGTTWTREVELLRRTRALDLLQATDLTLDSIAEASGYADARALRRAVRRWTGHTTTALRRPGSPAEHSGPRDGAERQTPGAVR
ncbi:helix-turn-helix domain-containing protein [Streptomyces sp. NPDC006339]|uniref:AraC family transcriptional regulator n=1 Tax=Streptomyces sp. NPDC006339 TaxID=3156755 RepID=UPI00339FB7D9